MPPNSTFATAQRPVTRSQSAGVKKKKAATSKKISRTRSVRSLNTSALDPTLSRRTARSPHTTPAQSESSPATPTVGSVTPRLDHLGSTTPEGTTQHSPFTRRKRKRKLEVESSGKRSRKQAQSEHEPAPSSLSFNGESLEKLNEEVRLQILNGMAGRKRSLSRRSSSVDLGNDATSGTSQKTSISLLDYRLVTLRRARIIVQHRGLPEHIQLLVDAIIQPDITEERKSVLFAIADRLCDAFPSILEVASREDDFVEQIERALEAIDSKLIGQVFTRRRKADFEPSIRPTAQRKSYLSGPPDKLVRDINDPSVQLSKWQQAQPPYISPETSANDMPPPSLPLKQDASLVKVPRPDITMGFLDTVIATKLEALNVDKLDAKEILEDLQFERVLYSSPTQPALLVRFPPLGVEGKAYGTGRSMYEAENQAAVSGTYMLVIQHQLAELTERRSPGSHQRKEPIAFSICNEGPDINLWVHYITWIQDASFYNMHLLAQCHATLRHTVKSFFITLLRVMDWASTELLDDIVAQLFLVWKDAQQHAA